MEGGRAKNLVFFFTYDHQRLKNIFFLQFLPISRLLNRANLERKAVGKKMAEIFLLRLRWFYGMILNIYDLIIVE